MFLHNLLFRTILLCFFHSTVQPSQRNQPKFHSSAKIWKTASKSSTHSISPFYKNEKRILFQIQHLINRRQDGKALKFLKVVVKTERSWRLQMCSRIFGIEACNNSGSENMVPFYLWKKRMIHHLLADPTHEIIQHIKRSLQVLQ